MVRASERAGNDWRPMLAVARLLRSLALPLEAEKLIRDYFGWRPLADMTKMRCVDNSRPPAFYWTEFSSTMDDMFSFRQAHKTAFFEPGLYHHLKLSFLGGWEAQGFTTRGECVPLILQHWRMSGENLVRIVTAKNCDRNDMMLVLFCEASF